MILIMGWADKEKASELLGNSKDYSPNPSNTKAAAKVI